MLNPMSAALVSGALTDAGRIGGTDRRRTPRTTPRQNPIRRHAETA